MLTTTSSPADRKVGTIVRLFPDKVFGFIHCPADARDYFFHQTRLDGYTFGQIAVGDAVSFTVGESPNAQGKVRLEAQAIRLVAMPVGVAPTPPRRKARVS